MQVRKFGVAPKARPSSDHRIPIDFYPGVRMQPLTLPCRPDLDDGTVAIPSQQHLRCDGLGETGGVGHPLAYRADAPDDLADCGSVWR